MAFFLLNIMEYIICIKVYILNVKYLLLQETEFCSLCISLSKTALQGLTTGSDEC